MTTRQPPPNELKNAEGAVVMMETLAEEHDRPGLPSSVLTEAAADYLDSVKASTTRTWLKKAGLAENPKRGFWKLTDNGRALLAQHPTRQQRTRVVLGKFDQVNRDEGRVK
jgi:restriction endonuclease Mrr